MKTRKNLSYWPLLAIALLAVLPVLASSALYLWRMPGGGHSVGTLLAQPLPAALASSWPQRQWVLLTVGAGCDRTCLARRFAVRQIHTAQGEAAARITRQHREHGAGLREDGFYLVDPHRNLVLFYPDGRAPTAVIREIGKVLKVNNGLG